MKVIKFVKENKNAIIVSLFVGVLLLFLKPILTFVGTRLVDLLITLSKGFSNHFYKLVAQNDCNLIDSQMAMIILVLFSLVIIQILSEPYERIRGLEKELADNEKKLRVIQLTNNGNIKDDETEEIDINKVEQLQNKLRGNLRRIKGMFKVGIGFFVFAYLYFSFMNGMYSLINAKNVSFQNKTIVLSTKLSDDQIKQLRAEWVQMKSAEDFNRIESNIKEYYDKYNLTE